MCCGLRSSDFGRICISTFVQPDTGDYIIVHNVGDDGRMVMTRTNSKIVANGLQRIPLPVWLADWLMEYEQHGMPHLIAGEEHVFLFVTPSGLPLARGDSYRVTSILSLMRQVLPIRTRLI